MVLTVDGRSDKVAQYAPGLYWLTNSYGFVGGLPEYKAKAFKTLHGNFRGCMKKVKYSVIPFFWLVASSHFNSSTF